MSGLVAGLLVLAAWRMDRALYADGLRGDIVVRLRAMQAEMNRPVVRLARAMQSIALSVEEASAAFFKFGMEMKRHMERFASEQH